MQLFEQRCAYPLRDASGHLGFDYGRIDQISAIVYQGMADDPDVSGFRVDLHYHRVCSIRVSGLHAPIETQRFESGINLWRKWKYKSGRIKRARDFAECQASMGLRELSDFAAAIFHRFRRKA